MSKWLRRQLIRTGLVLAAVLALTFGQAATANAAASFQASIGCNLRVSWTDYGNTAEFKSIYNDSGQTATFNLVGDGVVRTWSVPASSAKFVANLVSTDQISSMWARGYRQSCGPTAWYKIPNY